MTLVGWSLGLFVGLTLGLLGGGGSVLTVPLLVYVLGLEAKAAVAGSLAVVGVVALVGVWRHARLGNVEPRTAFVFGGVAMVGAFSGARAASLISGSTQLVLFAVVMLVAAFLMFRKGPAPHPPPGTSSEKPDLHASSPATVALTALGVGGVTGVVGVGGGFMIVPALVLILGLDMKRAVGTSLLVIALNAGAGFMGYVGQVEVPWVLLGGFTAFAIGGIVVGTRLMPAVPAATLRRSFALFLVIVACFMLVQNSGLLART